MRLDLLRDLFADKVTLSALSISYDRGLHFEHGKWVSHSPAVAASFRDLPFGDVCEDADRGLDASDPSTIAWKIAKVTAIPVSPPEGYLVTRTPSVRFAGKCPDGRMIEVCRVPGYHGIRVHPGNSEVDTEGCLLPGLGRDHALNRVVKSVIAWEWLDARVAECDARGEEVRLHIRRSAAWATAPHNPHRVG